MRDLNQIEKEVIFAVSELREANNRGPSIGEIARKVGITETLAYTIIHCLLYVGALRATRGTAGRILPRSLDNA